MGISSPNLDSGPFCLLLLLPFLTWSLLSLLDKMAADQVIRSDLSSAICEHSVGPSLGTKDPSF